MSLQVNYVCLIYFELQDRSLRTIQNKIERDENRENADNSKRPRTPDEKNWYV